MTVTVTNRTYMWDSLIRPRLGDDYLWGGCFDPHNVGVGADCSGAVGMVLTTLTHGPGVAFRHYISTMDYAGLDPGDTGPLGVVIVGRLADAPPDAAALVAILQGDAADTSHIICAVRQSDGGPYVAIESGGPENCLAIGAAATQVTDGEFNQWGYLPGPVIAAELSPADAGGLAIIAAGHALGITELGQQMGLCCALAESNMAMLANEEVPESMTLPHTGVGGDHDSCGPFQQRPSQGWGTVACEMNWTCSATLFFNALARTAYNGGGQSPGWHIQQVQRSFDASGSNYDARWNDAVALYNRLSTLSLPTEGFLMALTDQQQSDLYRAICGPVHSQSPFRSLGEGAIWEPAQMWLNDDGMAHPVYVEWAAALGDPLSMAVLASIAGGDVTQYPDRIEDIALAKATLARVNAGPLPTPVTPAVPTPDTAPTPTAGPVPGQVIVKTSTIVHSAITVLGGGLAVGTWVLHSFGDVMTPGITTAVSSAIAVGTGLLDFLVRSESLA